MAARSLRLTPLMLFVLAGLLLAVFFLVAQYGGLLGARLYQPDFQNVVGAVPLVRHAYSQAHCYDAGNRYCESLRNTAKEYLFTKEFSIGFIPRVEHINAESVELAGCWNKTAKTFQAVFGPAEVNACKAAKAEGFQYSRIGYLFTNDEAEAGTPLYRCRDLSSGDDLLTDSPTECATVGGYEAPELLGYMWGSGYLPQQRLNELCDAVAAANVPNSVRTAQSTFCHGAR